MPNYQNNQISQISIDDVPVPDTQELITNQNDSTIENKMWKTTMWNTFKKVLMIADILIDFLTTQRKTALGLLWNRNATLASPEAVTIVFIGMVEDIEKTNQKLYYNSKKEFFIDFCIKTLSLPIPLGVMLMRSNLPWGEMDKDWLDNSKTNSILNAKENLFFKFNNIPIPVFCLLSSSVLSKIAIVFLKVLNSLKH